CALWVNFDQWFFLGPIAVLLYLVGALLEPRPAFDRKGQVKTTENAYPTLDAGALKRLAQVLGVSLVACCLSPHHVRAFQLPAQLGFGPAAGVLHDDMLFQQLFFAPISSDARYYSLPGGGPGFGLSAAGMAVFPLLVVVGLSFVVNRRG